MAATNSKTLFPVPATFWRAVDEAFRGVFLAPVKRSDAVGRFFFYRRTERAKKKETRSVKRSISRQSEKKKTSAIWRTPARPYLNSKEHYNKKIRGANPLRKKFSTLAAPVRLRKNVKIVCFRRPPSRSPFASLRKKRRNGAPAPAFSAFSRFERLSLPLADAQSHSISSPRSRTIRRSSSSPSISDSINFANFSAFFSFSSVNS